MQTFLLTRRNKLVILNRFRPMFCSTKMKFDFKNVDIRSLLSGMPNALLDANYLTINHKLCVMIAFCDKEGFPKTENFQKHSERDNVEVALP